MATPVTPSRHVSQLVSHAVPFLALAGKVEARCREAQTSGPSITVED